MEEIRVQLELDDQRGAAPLPVRAKALRAASAAGDRQAERQALIDLAAACLARAASLAAPRVAIAEFERRSGRQPRQSRLERRRAA